jgi:hypothetical protein
MSDRIVTATVLAHQGGWDEILLVAGPIVVIIFLLAVVKRRVDAAMPLQSEAHDEASGEPPPAA